MDPTRKLATIEKIDRLTPIPDSDYLAVATLVGRGWNVVVRKDEVAQGDMVVFFEIDSVLPAHSCYEFLGRPKTTKVPGILPDGLHMYHVLKTKKLRGVVSQGLILTFSHFARYDMLTDVDVKTGTDLTAVLGIMHIDALREAEDAATGKGYTLSGAASLRPLPGFVPVTRQTRIESDTGILERNAGRTFSVERKYDGSSMSVFYLDKRKYMQKGITSHHRLLSSPPGFLARFTDPVKGLPLHIKILKFLGYAKSFITRVFTRRPGKAQGSTNVFLDTAESMRLLEMAEKTYKATGRNLIYQGELVGPKCNGNRDCLTEHTWYLFDIYDLDAGEYMLPAERAAFYEQHLKDYAPSVDTLLIIPDISKYNVDMLQELADYKTNNGNMAEGIVCKSMERPYESFKCVSRKYLLTRNQ